MRRATRDLIIKSTLYCLSGCEIGFAVNQKACGILANQRERILGARDVRCQKSRKNFMLQVDLLLYSWSLILILVFFSILY